MTRTTLTLSVATTFEYLLCCTIWNILISFLESQTNICIIQFLNINILLVLLNFTFVTFVQCKINLGCPIENGYVYFEGAKKHPQNKNWSVFAFYKIPNETTDTCQTSVGKNTTTKLFFYKFPSHHVKSF